MLLLFSNLFKTDLFNRLLLLLIYSKKEQKKRKWREGHSNSFDSIYIWFKKKENRNVIY